MLESTFFLALLTHSGDTLSSEWRYGVGWWGFHCTSNRRTDRSAIKREARACECSSDQWCTRDLLSMPLFVSLSSIMSPPWHQTWASFHTSCSEAWGAWQRSELVPRHCVSLCRQEVSQVRTVSGTELADRIDYGIVNCHVGTFAFVCGCHSFAGVRIR